MGVSRKQSTPNFPKNEHFLPPDTHTYVCVSGVNKCLFFGKLGVLCFLEIPVLRFALLPYYPRNIGNASMQFIIGIIRGDQGYIPRKNLPRTRLRIFSYDAGIWSFVVLISFSKITFPITFSTLPTSKSSYRTRNSRSIQQITVKHDFFKTKVIMIFVTLIDF